MLAEQFGSCQCVIMKIIKKRNKIPLVPVRHIQPERFDVKQRKQGRSEEEGQNVKEYLLIRKTTPSFGSIKYKMVSICFNDYYFLTS